MPGRLKRNAKCPKCGDPLLALVDTTGSLTVKREFFHDRREGAKRRRRPCVKVFLNYDKAQAERRALEVRGR